MLKFPDYSCGIIFLVDVYIEYDRVGSGFIFKYFDGMEDAYLEDEKGIELPTREYRIVPRKGEFFSLSERSDH